MNLHSYQVWSNGFPRLPYFINTYYILNPLARQHRCEHPYLLVNVLL